MNAIGIAGWLQHQLEMVEAFLLTGSRRCFAIKLDEGNPGSREMLQEKIKTYKIRESYGEHYPSKEHEVVGKDALYKRVIAERLLENGEVTSLELARDLWRSQGLGYRSEYFRDAFGVIADYVCTGGRNLGRMGKDGIVHPLSETDGAG